MFRDYFDFNSLEKISSIPIGTQTDFELRLNNEQHKIKNQLTEKSRYIIGYGRNGSGKSTISNFISKLIKKDIKPSLPCLISTIDGNSYSIETMNQKLGFENIHVFNTDFINRNVFASDNDLEAIVMIGTEAEDQRKFERLEKVRLKVENRFEVRTKEQKNVLSNIMNEITRIERSYFVKAKGRTNSRSQGVLKSNYFGKLECHEEVQGIDQLRESVEISEVENLLKILDDTIALQSEEEINFGISSFKNLDLSFVFLEQIVKKPILTERETKIVEYLGITGSYTTWLEQGQTFSGNLEDTCPLCFNQIDTIEFDNKINEIISPEVKRLRDLIKNKIKTITDIKKENYERMNGNKSLIRYENRLPGISDVLEEIKNKNTEVNELYEFIIKIVKDKYDNVFNIFELASLEPKLERLSYLIKEINKSYASLESKRVIYNKSIENVKKDIESQRKVLLAKIEQLTCETVFTEYKEYKRLTSNTAWLRKTKREIQDETDRIKGLARDLTKSERDINRALNFIFCSGTKMKVELTTDVNDIPGYKVLIDGDVVKKNELSTGEQNILALIYYFKSLNAEKDIEQYNQVPIFLVIDDPLSSLDDNNLVGLMSYIHWKVKKILLNEKSRVLLMTHGWFVFDSMCKLARPSYTGFELIRKNGETRQNMIQNSDRVKGYSHFLKDTYKYANAPEEIDESSIGNIIRKSMEAFFTFNYKIGLDDALGDAELREKILANNTEEMHELFYDNFAINANRLILNTESHQQDSAANLGREFSEFTFSEEELTRLSKGWIGFLYMYNKQHLFKHIGKNEEVEATIKTWIEESA